MYAEKSKSLKTDKNNIPRGKYENNTFENESLFNDDINCCLQYYMKLFLHIPIV